MSLFKVNWTIVLPISRDWMVPYGGESSSLDSNAFFVFVFPAGNHKIYYWHRHLVDLKYDPALRVTPYKTMFMFIASQWYCNCLRRKRLSFLEWYLPNSSETDFSCSLIITSNKGTAEEIMPSQLHSSPWRLYSSSLAFSLIAVTSSHFTIQATCSRQSQ